MSCFVVYWKDKIRSRETFHKRYRHYLCLLLFAALIVIFLIKVSQRHGARATAYQNLEECRSIQERTLFSSTTTTWSKRKVVATREREKEYILLPCGITMALCCNLHRFALSLLSPQPENWSLGILFSAIEFSRAYVSSNTPCYHCFILRAQSPDFKLKPLEM